MLSLHVCPVRADTFYLLLCECLSVSLCSWLPSRGTVQCHFTQGFHCTPASSLGQLGLVYRGSTAVAGSLSVCLCSSPTNHMVQEHIADQCNIWQCQSSHLQHRIYFISRKTTTHVVNVNLPLKSLGTSHVKHLHSLPTLWSEQENPPQCQRVTYQVNRIRGAEVGHVTAACDAFGKTRYRKE